MCVEGLAATQAPDLTKEREPTAAAMARAQGPKVRRLAAGGRRIRTFGPQRRQHFRDRAARGFKVRLLGERRASSPKKSKGSNPLSAAVPKMPPRDRAALDRSQILDLDRRQRRPRRRCMM